MYIKVHVTPGAKKESFEQKSETVFEVKIKERAQKNLANNRILELVAAHFKVQTRKVRMVSGHRHPSKLLFIEEGN
ncbi:MAG: DUF167 domain-containing protein [bacterium]|nr:DUF167 domain-containing protein [bacterium]